jgi:hypothetical protein
MTDADALTPAGADALSLAGADARTHGPDPAQAKSNTTGKTRTTVQAHAAYTIM